MQFGQWCARLPSGGTITTRRRSSMAKFQKALSGNRLSYFGEVCDRAHVLSVEQVVPGLPPAGICGSVSSQLPWLCDPMLCLKPRSEILGTSLRGGVLCHIDDWDQLASALVSRGIVDSNPSDDILDGSNGKVLDGIFGVPKLDKPLTETRPARRMNFVPINAYLLEHLGEVRSLPRTGQWRYLCCREQRCTEKTRLRPSTWYELPSAWRLSMAFSPGFGRGGTEKVFFTARVMPMAWFLAVAATQDIGGV